MYGSKPTYSTNTHGISCIGVTSLDARCNRPVMPCDWHQVAPGIMYMDAAYQCCKRPAASLLLLLAALLGLLVSTDDVDDDGMPGVASGAMIFSGAEMMVCLSMVCLSWAVDREVAQMMNSTSIRGNQSMLYHHNTLSSCFSTAVDAAPAFSARNCWSWLVRLHPSCCCSKNSSRIIAALATSPVTLVNDWTSVECCSDCEGSDGVSRAAIMPCPRVHTVAHTIVSDSIDNLSLGTQ
jgi:hypothetical protein